MLGVILFDTLAFMLGNSLRLSLGQSDPQKDGLSAISSLFSIEILFLVQIGFVILFPILFLILLHVLIHTLLDILPGVRPLGYPPPAGYYRKP